MAEKQEFSKYERARVMGARALQLSMDAPLLMKVDAKQLEAVNYDPLKLAELEIDSGVLPISVNRPLPEKRDEKLVEIKLEELEKEEEVAKKEETKEDEDEATEVRVEARAQEVTDMKTEEDVEDEIEETGVAEAGEDSEGGFEE